MNNSLGMAAVYVVQTLGGLYVLVALLRFLLQTVRADFYNPISQFVVRATQPLLAPLRRVIPGFGGLDLASLVLTLLVQMLVLVIIFLLALGSLPNILQLLVWSMVAVVALLTKVFFFALIISVILSWVAPASRNPAALLVHQLCEPLLVPIRRILPSLGGLDLSPIFGFIALRLVDMLVVAELAKATGMPPGLTLAL